VEPEEALGRSIEAGDRRALAQGVTLVESARSEDRARAARLLETLREREPPALRLAVTGPPGAGKSTLIDKLGALLIAEGQRIAVLAIDPTSQVTGGSILGDKTRMSGLLRDARAFIRPSPSGSAAGGVAERTREALRLCEAAGFDTVIIETLGVGQGEQAVRDIVDVCLVVLLAGAGDELTGIKRGLLEVGDLFVVNKADGAGESEAQAARAMYESALGTLQGRPTQVLAVSAIESTGLSELRRAIADRFAESVANGELVRERSRQRARWFESLLRVGAVEAFLAQPRIQAKIQEFMPLVQTGALDAVAAAARVFACLDAVDAVDDTSRET